MNGEDKGVRKGYPEVEWEQGRYPEVESGKKGESVHDYINKLIPSR